MTTRPSIETRLKPLLHLGGGMPAFMEMHIEPGGGGGGVLGAARIRPYGGRMGGGPAC